MHKGRAINPRYTAIVVSVLSLLVLLFSVFFVVALRATPARAADISNSYAWKQLKIGGGGFVTGLIIHPKTPGLVYARTDVGGAYRWDETSQTWSQLLLAGGVPNPTASDYNVESIALSQTNDQIVYVAVGSTWNLQQDTPSGRILKSTDRGQSWTDSGQRWAIGGNNEYRQGGERLAVDPANENIVYFGSRTMGLWVSTDGAAHWSQISTSQIPLGSNSDANNPAGVKLVAFDPSKGTTSGKTNRVYVGVAGQGLYRSDDAGATWTNVYGSCPLLVTSSTMSKSGKNRRGT